MDEIEKMRLGLLADMSARELQSSFRHCKGLLARMRAMSPYDEEYRALLEALVPGIPATSVIHPPFHCDHGHGITLGEHVFVNAGCTFLDGGRITVGDYTLIGPGVQLLTPVHPMEARERRRSVEWSFPVRIGKDCWIGAGAIVCPGVTVGDRSVIGAGSVVTHDVAEGTLVAGNPARVIRRLE